MKAFMSNGVHELPAIARKILQGFPEARIFAFYGEMGAGKTTLIKAFCRELQTQEQASSPTFSLVNEYYSPRTGPVYHFDFYRMEKIEEVFDIGYEDYFYSGNYCLLEWPELIEQLLPENYVYISIKLSARHQRMIRCRAV
ncbi:MAG: tRNA (adenosine(37)-N6)-threonylcarbamoyltransferase complex ATPase subunit type 1 TsaE [Bacteroidales bacterium]